MNEEKDNELKDVLNNLINKAMQDNLTYEEVNEGSLPYTTPKEYLKVTGKRFRIKPSQKAAGLTREQAFEEFLAEQRSKDNG